MGRIIGRFITLVLTILAIAIIIVTVCITLEFLEIIKVPEQYSLLKFLDSNLELISSVGEYIETNFDIKNSKDVEDNTNSIVVQLGGNKVTTIYLEDNQQIENQHTGEQYSEEQQIIDFRYYDQLDENAKKMYEALERDKELLKTGNHKINFGTEFNEFLQQENGSELLNNSFQLAVNAFLIDHPEIFYIDVTKIYILTEITTRPFSKTYKVSIGANEGSYLYEEYTNQEVVNSVINQIEEIKQSIIQNANGTTYEKIKYVHDYLIETTEYEKTVETYNNYTIYGTFLNKKAVCEGYAKAFKYILDTMGIPCIMVWGTGTNSAGQTENHAWNYVFIDNNWYAVDVTWDDPIIIGTGFITKNVKYKYFLKGANNFLLDHVEDGNIVDSISFQYPDLNSTDYE